MKDRILSVLIPLLIRDWGRLQALVITGAIALAGTLSVRLAGVELTTSQVAMVTTITTIVMGYLFEILLSNENKHGIKGMQTALKSAGHAEVDVDGHAGKITVAAAQDMAIENATKK